MRLNSLILTVCLVGLLTATGAAVAQDLDANWLLGKWQGETQPQSSGAGGARPAQIVIQVKADGTFEGESQSPQLPTTNYQDGKWKIAGDTAIFEYRTDVTTRFAGRQITNSTWTLKRNGEDLEGTGVNRSTSFQFALKLKKAK